MAKNTLECQHIHARFEHMRRVTMAKRVSGNLLSTGMWCMQVLQEQKPAF